MTWMVAGGCQEDWELEDLEVGRQDEYEQLRSDAAGKWSW